MRIIDLHCDTISCLMEPGEKYNLRCNPFHIDIEKLQGGNVMAQFFALYVNMQQVTDPLAYCLAMLDRFYQELEKNNDCIGLALNSQELENTVQSGRIAAVLTVEEGGVLKGNLANLRLLHRLGVRLITLTWNYPNEIGFPNITGEFRDKGLTPFGEAVVTEMNRLGMIIDVSHLSDQGFYDVAKLSKHPFIASHSNARQMTNHARNLTDEMIKVLAERGGVTGINFAKQFLGTAPMSRVEDMIRHIRHIYQIGGIDVIALGSDFDGISCDLEIKDMSQIKKLIDALEKAGFDADEIEKICWKNALRVLKDVLGS